MSADRPTGPADDQFKPLRDQVARLISRTLELERQVEDLQRARAELTIETVAASLVQALRSAEQALADDAEAGAGLRYTVAELQATLRAGLARQQGRLVVSLPRPELALAPEALSSLHLTLAHVPTLPAPREITALGAALERAQTAFVDWPTEAAGSPAAGEMTAEATRLLAAREQWTEPALLERLLALAQSAVALANTVGPAAPTEPLTAFRSAVGGLLERLRPPLATGQAAPGDLLGLAEAIEQLTRTYRALIGALRS
jgi:hypothetical protein